MSPKMGQKITDNPKNKLIQVRMDKETVEKLDYLGRGLKFSTTKETNKKRR